MSDNGFKVADDGNLEIESIKVRSFLEAAELNVGSIHDLAVLTNHYVETPSGIAEYLAEKEDGAVFVREGCFVTAVYPKEKITPIDKRTAFLSRLGALLKEFNAFLSADAVGSYCGDDVERVTLIIGIGDGCILNYNIADPNVIITADNKMDFEKE